MKTRIISAIVALIIVVPLIFLGGIYFQLGVCVLATLAYKEMLDLKGSHQKYPTFIEMMGLFLMVILILANNVDASIYMGITYQMLVLLLLMLLVPIIFYKNENYNSKDALYLIGMILFLGLIFNIFIIIRNRGLYTFLFLLIIPIINDIFAYLIGSKFGRNKMCVKISPNKTWEGSIGGLILGTATSLIFYKIMIGNISFKIISLVLILSIVGQMGDLIMSKIKRENKIKDFSNIMPGHGGILDRIDSAIFVFLAYMFLIIW